MNQRGLQQLINSFRDKGNFSRQQLYQYFVETEGALTVSALGWRIHELKQKDILQEVETGWYTLAIKPVYTPTPDHRIKKIDKLLKSTYQGASHCTWSVDWLNEFTVHQFTRDTFIVETEKDLVESVGYTLRNNGFLNVLWTIRGTQLSVTDTEDPVFLLPLISRAPLQQVATEKGKFVTCPTLEKILVDIYDGNKIFHFIQGAELKHIFEHALTRYAVNLTTLLGYAKRRGKEPELSSYLHDHFSDIIKSRIE